MTITIKLNTTNAAFEDDPTSETNRIINEYVKDATRLGFHALGNVTLLDRNGNTVGSVTVRGK